MIRKNAIANSAQLQKVFVSFLIALVPMSIKPGNDGGTVVTVTIPGK